MSIKNKKERPLHIGRTKKFTENISVTPWKNDVGCCAACRTYKAYRFKIEVSKPIRKLDPSGAQHYYTHHAFVCSKVCRTMYVLQNMT